MVVALQDYRQEEREKSMRQKCKCKRCGWTWVSRITGGPKACPGCKSTAWRTISGLGSEVKVNMVCSICNDKFEEGQTIFRFQEGKNINGIFVPEGVESQGLYCEKCAPEEDILPFAK